VKFYTRFAACYGTIWLVMLIVALISGTNINTGYFGLIGFPAISLIFAFVQDYREKHFDQDENYTLDKKIADIQQQLNDLKTEQLIREENRKRS
jgi:hypothetical protein